MSSRPPSNEAFVEPMDDKCTPCDQYDDEDGSGNRRRGGRRNRRSNNGEEEDVPIEDEMGPSDPNFANIQTIREQRMVQRQSILSNLKNEFESLFLSPPASFCEHNKTNSSALQKQCSALTYNNCNSTSCCVWVGKSSQFGKCAAGDATGTMFKTNADGEPINVDTYYYKNKCFGSQCPLAKIIQMSRVKKAMAEIQSRRNQDEQDEQDQLDQ
jgi:hypothetical protein